MKAPNGNELSSQHLWQDASEPTVTIKHSIETNFTVFSKYEPVILPEDNSAC